MPEFIKKAELETPATGLGNQFADPDNKRYPVHNKSACYLSNALFWESALSNDTESVKTGQALLKFAEFWGILDDVKARILSKVAEEGAIREITQLPDTSFALVQDDPKSPGNKIRMFPILDADMAKVAADQLYMHRFNLPLDWKRQAATNILGTLQKNAQVEFLPDNVLDYLNRAAGNGVTSTKTLAAALEKRAQLLAVKRLSDVGSELKKIAQQLKTQRSSRSLCVKVASMLDKLDTDTGLFRHYSNSLELPEEVCHAVLEKHAVAELTKYACFPSGSTYLISDLAPATGVFKAAGYDVTDTLGELDTKKLRDFTKTASPQAAAEVDVMLAKVNVPTRKLPIDLHQFQS